MAGRKLKPRVKNHLNKLSKLRKNEALKASRFSRANLIIFGITFTSIGGYLVFSSFAAEAPTGTANLWIDGTTTNNTCQRSAIPVAYDDTKACSSGAAAYAAASCGDTVRIPNGTYSGLSISGTDKTCAQGEYITFRPEDNTPNPAWSASNRFTRNANLQIGGGISVSVDYVRVMDMDAQSVNAQGVNNALPSDLRFTRFDRVEAIGNGTDTGGTVFIKAWDLEWYGGSAGGFDACEVGGAPEGTDLDGFRLWGTNSGGQLYSSKRITVDGLVVHDVVNTQSYAECTQHTDGIQLFGGYDITFRNIVVRDLTTNSVALIARPQGSPDAGLDNLRIENSMIDIGNGAGSKALSMGSGTDQCSNMISINNSFGGSVGVQCQGTGNRYINNISNGCVSASGWTITNNVFTSGVTCGNNAKSCTPAYLVANHASSNFRITSGDTCAKDAGATTANNFTTTDIDGENRPAGIAPDIGADEYSSGSTTPPPAPGCIQSSSSWQNNSFTSQTGSFTFDYDATPSADNIDAVVGLSNGNAGSYSDLGVIARFNDTGNIDARNGGAYAAINVLNYTAGISYHFKMTVNVANHTYSLTVTPAGGSITTIATNYSFRTEQAGVTNLNNWAINSSNGPLSICAAVLNVSTSPKLGDINQDNNVNITDLSILMSSFGQTTTSCSTNPSFICDIATTPASTSGKVDIFDLSVLLSRYGS